ncbi:DsbA family protein [Lapidilactobacillus luobeiensis]|uniref:DsbA family protein n=1 Tax=Lapidilactobacillus luobeiensis TaxID=2950371 RepID=UPI0021C416C7|nr:DsbA family protein [Lapidilactobacillus luobeiensis]
MLEIFMFANPIGGLCLNTEVNIIRGLKQHKLKVQPNLVPITNMNVVTDFLKRNHLDTRDLVLRNQVMAITFQSMLDYKAASFQGNKKARAFTMSLQDHLNEGLDCYSEALIKLIAHEVHLDEATFFADRQSQLAKDLCEADRQLANNLGVKKTPSTVFIDYREVVDGDGILVNGAVTPELINQILNKQLPRKAAAINQKPFLRLLGRQQSQLHLI